MLQKGTIAVSRTVISSQKLRSPVRIAVVADLHNCRYGPRQQALLNAVDAEKPDLIALTGDIFDRRESERHAVDALLALSARYPCYYVTGNHERSSRRVRQIFETVRHCGVLPIGGAALRLAFGGQTILLCGLDDWQDGSPAMTAQLQTLTDGLDARTYSVLLSHRPERFATLLKKGFDLMLSGHTHGGQWRLPFAKNGVYAPGQGLFPKFAGGSFDVNGKTLVVSRGLSYKPRLLPRIGNPPELVFVTLLPEEAWAQKGL